MTNQRAFPRFPLTLEATVTLPGQGTQVCQVRDYCAGGMFLLYGSGHRPVAEGTDITIHFSNPDKPSERYQMEGRIARVMDHGMGVSFTATNQVALMVLAQVAEKQAASQQQVRAQIQGDISTLLRRVRQIASTNLQGIVSEFFTTADDRLFNAAQESVSNVQQSAFFGAINELKRGRKNLTDTILAECEDRLGILDQANFKPRAISPDAKSGLEDGLSLVDSQEFDNWLMVRAIASKVEGRIPDILDALETRLNAIAQNPISKESNPVGPLALASVFSEALDKLVLEDDAKKALFLVLESSLDNGLHNLYDELNEMLIGSGVLPELKKRMEVVKAPVAEGEYFDEELEEPEEVSQPSMPASRPPGGGAPRPVAPSQSQAQIQPRTAPAASMAQPAASSAFPPSQGTHAPASAPAPASGPAAPRLNYSRPAIPVTGVAATPMPAFQGVQELMHLRGATPVPAAAPNGFFSSGEVVQALAHLEGIVGGDERHELDAMGHAQYLAQTLSQLTGEEGKGLSEADRDAISYVGGIFTAMHQDAHLTPLVRQWLGRMEVPLLKAGLIDPSVVEDATHPARQVVNQLEQVGRQVSSDTSEKGEDVRGQVESLIEVIQKRVDQDPEVFAETLGRLVTIGKDYHDDYRYKVNRIIQQCEQESSLNRVRDAILAALNELLGHREVPKVILKLLESGLKNLLFRTHVREGPQSEAYLSCYSFIDVLTARLARREPVKTKKLADDATLLQWLPRMLATASKDEDANAALIAEVDGYLRGVATPAMQYVPALTIKAAHLDEVNNKPEGLDTDAWQLVLDDARHLDDGDAFLYEDEEQGKAVVKLIWHDEADKPPRYVFADDNGDKRLDISLGKVANLLQRKKLARNELSDLSVTERATYDFLQNIHNNLSFQAQHDELTGLLNRKAFERALESAYNEAIAAERSGVLAYFDLDRFNVINTTCGHASGDELLKEVAEIMQEAAGEDATVARLGGDEFGVILEGASRVEGLKRITELHEKLREIRFTCEENEFSVSASVGLAEINQNIDSSGRLLSAVDAACFTAKDQGRDNIQIHNAENARISNRTTILEWVGRINVLFEKNLIQLRCQKIEPVNKTITSLPHYEILLDVYDGEGNKVPLDEFIVAAERYNRITDIDTWVIDHVFSWLEEHRSKLSRINGLSINISGASMGNRKFMEHLEGKLSEPDFPADKVIFEVTESIAINNLDNAARFMRKIKETGCKFSLDDFGSGTSSYSYLKSLPIDYLKIDGSFVKDIAKNSSDYAVVKSINEIGHVMGKKTVAENVEDEFAFQALKAIGLDYVQGFGIEKPTPLYKLFG